jgi:hypothetical protein
VLIGEVRKHVGIDRIVAKRLRVLPARSIWPMTGKSALSVACGEQKYRKRVCGSLVTLLRSKP